MKKKTLFLHLFNLTSIVLLSLSSLSQVSAENFSLASVPVGGVVIVSGVKFVRANEDGLFLVVDPDIIPPAIPILSPATQTWTRNNIDVLISGSDVGYGMAYYQYCLSTAATCVPNVNATSLTIENEGEYTVCARAVDKAGNTVTGCSVDKAYKLDRTSPTSPSLSPTSQALTNSNITVSFSGSTDVGGSGITHYQYCATTGSSCTPATNGSSVTLSNNGQYKVCAQAVDGAGNVSTMTCSADQAYKIDKNGPTAPTLSPNSRTWSSANMTVSFSGSTDAGGSGFSHYQYCTTTGTSCTPATTGSSVTITTNGQHKVCAQAVDGAGNVSTMTCSANYAYKIDKYIPNMPSLTPASATVTFPTKIHVDWYASDNTGGSGVSYYEYCESTNGNTCTPSIAASSINLYGEGNYIICVRAKDVAGNIGNTTCSAVGDYKIESGVPAVPAGCHSTCNVVNPSPYNFNMQNFTAEQCAAVPTPTGTGCTLVGNMRDTRDGKFYEIRKFADGKCWMVDNLAYGGASDACAGKTTFDGTGSSAVTNRFGAGTYGDCRDNPGTNYGYLYNWQATMQNSTAFYASNYTGGTVDVRGICPSGWTIPTGNYYSGGDFGTLHTAVGSPDTGFWQGCAWKGPLPGYCLTTGVMKNKDGEGRWWTTESQSDYDAHFLRFFKNNVDKTFKGYKDFGLSVRCIKRTW